MFSPFKVRKDGTRVFASPIGDEGVVPFVSLEDIGWWARYVFDNAATTTGRSLGIASQPATFPEIVETFKRVTGLPAEYKPLSMDEYFGLWNGNEVPVANNVTIAEGGTSWEDNFRAFFAQFRDHLIKRDMDWIRSIHEPTTLEQWMREHDYKGVHDPNPILKKVEDRQEKLRPRREALAKL